MKVLLVRPPVPPHTIGLKHIMICEPLELEYAAAGLHGHEIQILDLIIEKGFEKRLMQFQPDVLATSCYITGVNEVIKICRKTKLWNKECYTVVGGVQAAQVPEDFADASVDCIVLGDGTSLLPVVIDALDTGLSLDNIPGLAFPVSPVEVARTEGKPYMPDADSLPLPRRDLVAHLKHRYYYLLHQPVATMKTTWGCWYKCNFCYTWRITDGLPYSRSAESIVEELENIEAEDVYIVDDIFLINKARLRKIADMLKERDIRKKYLVYARADFISENEDVIAEWADLGLSAVFIGLEAATNSELDSMNKECTVDYNRKAIEVLRKHRVDTYGSLIPNPDYTPEEWDSLWQFIEETGLYYVNISPLTPMPGTVIWPQYKDSVSVPREAHGLWDLSHAVLPTRMELKPYYRALLKLYAKTILNIRRADKHVQRTLPSIWSWKYARLLWGALKIGKQFWRAHHHHSSKELEKAMDKGPEVPGLAFKLKPGKCSAGAPPATMNLDAQLRRAGRPPYNVALRSLARIETFFDRNPGFNPRHDKLLNTRSSRRWFEILQKGMEDDLYTFQRPFFAKTGPRAEVDGRTIQVMSSYDYLGLIGHAAIEQAAIDAIHEFGTGTGGVRLLTGTNKLHEELEFALSQFTGMQSSMLFTSGYLANLTAIASLFDSRDCVIADEYVHRSLLDALKLGGIRHHVFRHNDVNDLERKLNQHARKDQRTLIIVESIYSMDGDICPLKDVLELKEENDALLLVDEAHGLGVLGESGHGIAEHFHIDPARIDLITGSLSKAIASSGGFLAAREEVVHFLKHGGAPFMFSASLAPSSAKAAIASLHVIQQEGWRLQKLWTNTRTFLQDLQRFNLQSGSSETPIIPVICGENQRAFQLSRQLYDLGYLASAVVYPAVPARLARLRLCVTAAMDEFILRRFAEDMSACMQYA